MKYNVLVLAAVIGLIIGFVGAWLIKPTKTVDFTKYEFQEQLHKLENEIQESKHREEISRYEAKFLRGLHYVEIADSTKLDSLWNDHGFNGY